MITRDIYRLASPQAPNAVYVGTMADCLENAAKLSIPTEIALEPHCSCCGLCGWGYSLSQLNLLRSWDGSVRGDLTAVRCSKHLGRNPCAIEGCTKTTKAEGRHASDSWLCAEHWRIGCPPRSKTRLVYHRYFRRAKRFGWNDESAASFNAFWRRLVARARKRCAGDIDMNEINAMFGWSE